MTNEAKWFRTQAEMARRFGVDPKTIAQWIHRPWFPKRNGRSNAWPVEAVCNAVEKHNDEQARRADGYGDRAEKTRLECERLRVAIEREREILEQARDETKKQRGQLVKKADVKKIDGRIVAALKNAVDSWTKTETAKVPAMRALIARLTDSFLNTLDDAMRQVDWNVEDTDD